MSTIAARPAEAADTAELAGLLAGLPRGEHVFLKRSVDGVESALQWLADTPATWLVARVGGALAGAVGVVPRDGWSSHVSELRLVVAAAHRRRGVGAALARAGLLTAVEHGALVVVVEALAEQEGVLALFRGLGFVPEALLTDHVRDEAGDFHDLVVLASSTAATTARLLTVGADEELDG